MDHALLLALRAWRVQPEEMPWRCLAPSWLAQLKPAWNAHFSSIDPEFAWTRLSRTHQAEAIFDFAQVHPSWIVRALQGESTPVRRAVIAHFPAPLREAVSQALAIDSLERQGPTHPEALGWVQAFWAERLVGGPPLSADDPPVVRAIAGLAPKDLARLIRAIGRAKSRLSKENMVMQAVEDGEVDRSLFSPEFRRIRDLGLLQRVGPFRERWTLQHLPYAVTKQFRMKSDANVPEDEVLAFESAMLQTSWKNLEIQGKIRLPWEVVA
jgi:hypothetical protein